MKIPIAIKSSDANRILLAKYLSEKLNSTIVDSKNTEPFCLVITDQQLQLHAPELGKPIFIDFTEGKNAHRRKFGGGRGQPLAKAIGLKKGATPTVIDATAGYGRDAFVIANLGCQVTLIERQTLLWALLNDAIKQAKQHQEIAEIGERMRLVNASSIDYLNLLEPSAWPDVIYMDPMYPSRDKSALVKKEMQLLHKLVGADTDSNDLLSIAKQRVKKRVVVKRPKNAEFVGDQKPTVSIEGKTTRYDVYVTTID